MPNEFDVYGNYVVNLHVYDMRSRSPTPTYKQPLYGCQPDEPPASLATSNKRNHIYVVVVCVLLFMYAVLHCLYSDGNIITTTAIITDWLNRWALFWVFIFGIIFLDTLKASNSRAFIGQLLTYAKYYASFVYHSFSLKPRHATLPMSGKT